jgi:uncharacterized protein with von Willebrand factor type A (vWA) domain
MRRLEMADDGRILTDLKDKLEKIKREMAQNEGSIQTIFDRVKKDFGVNTPDEAYELLEKMNAELEIKREQRDDLLKIAEEKLAQYRG